MAEDENIEHDAEFEGESGGMDENIIRVSGMYREWFLDYASYVILERAVPHLNDGLKPVQRRILHSMYEMEDGRYHKVANIIGNTMKFHPHGDAAIGDALVQIGQKDLLIDTQGNWGNLYTGDSAAAPRYIEARLSKFALDVVFNPKTTHWQLSYDGRAKEPITFPVKFPLLLAQGVEGIAVGMACKILPHNFNELIDGCIAVLKGKKPQLLPDFHTGGLADFSGYNDGLRGGRIRVRARIKKADAKTLLITEIPFGTTTGGLIESIIKANDKGKIKVKKVEDNTAENVEIVIHLAPGVSPDKTIDALYAFTDCEVSISPNAAVIENDKPRFMGVSELLKQATDNTLHLLTTELEIKKSELQEQWHFSSLEKIFIEKRIYRKIEECETWEEIMDTIHKGLKPYAKQFLRKITDEDVAKLTEIKIKRISRFDSFKADELIKKLEDDIKHVQHNLDHVVEYAVEYFKTLKKKYGEGRERKTEIKSFETIDAAKVAVNNVKLYANLDEGFVGYGMRNDGQFICDCSDIDDLIIFRKDGTMQVSKITGKAFYGKDILHVAVWRKGDKRTIYHLVYRDGKAGATYIKRFSVTAITRDKLYPLTRGAEGSAVLYFSANPNGEAEVITVLHKPRPGLKKLKFDFDFSQLAIKGRDAQGNILTKVPVQKITQKEKGASTLSARKIWFDDTVQRLNAEGRGSFLGEFKADEKILTVMQSGDYLLTGYDLSTHFEEDMILIEKFNPEKPLSAIYFDGEKKQFFVKRFMVEPSDKKVRFISEHAESALELVTSDYIPQIQLTFAKEKGKEREAQVLNLFEFISVKGLKALGNKLSPYKIKQIDLLEPIQQEPDKVEQMSFSQDFEEEDDPTAEIKSLLKTESPSVGKKNTGGSKQTQLDFD